ncbi:MAG TPA: hypothetical protein VKV73_32760 [Chloroflexota bacterium]|nr:hypothetical protein [Chloroflexota bacterium]
MIPLLNVRETFTPADHQTHRRYPFEVPPACAELRIWVRYTPKHLTAQESFVLIEAAVGRQIADLATQVGEAMAARWATGLGQPAKGSRVGNLLTVSLDDAEGTYRGAGHRQANDQRLALGPTTASPGLIAGPLPPGTWTLTLSAHTLVSAQCELAIQIDAETASSC